MTIVTPIRDIKAYLEAHAVIKILDLAKNLRNKLLVRIPWCTGIRVSEMNSLSVQDIDFENRALIIKIQKKRRRNGNTQERRRVVPVDRITLSMIKDYLEWRKQFGYNGDLLFPISRQRINQIYWQLGRKAGIGEIGDPAVSKYRKFHPHHLRHSFSIHCIKNGMSIDRLQKILGHASPTTTSVYLQYSIADLHEDYDKIWEDEEKND